MKISIQNFKSINHLHNFELKPLTVLSGINSSGKSSFIQLLLLLKQTIELDSSKVLLLLDGDYYRIRNFNDVISNKDFSKKLSICFDFSKSEIIQFRNLKTIPIFNSFGEYNCSITVKFDVKNGDVIFISLFSVIFNFDNGKSQFIKIESNSERGYSVKTNTGVFGKEISHDKRFLKDIRFLSIYPTSYEMEEIHDTDFGTEPQVNKGLFDFDDIKSLLNFFLQNISYIGPNRDDPKEEYSFNKAQGNVGSKGQFVAQILEEEASSPINFYKIECHENGIKYLENKDSLIDAVKYWMCNVFDVAEDLITQKINETYKIFFINKFGLKTNIKHVGFGISQLLPIVVEGLIMSNNGTLVVEQPEIHLHPKIQSQLYDFLYSLILHGKKVIVETHSNHFITRMRRRVAEDEGNLMVNKLGLTFIEGNSFRSIDLDNYGTLDYYPENFIEQSNNELKAILKAQMKKRSSNDK